MRPDASENSQISPSTIVRGAAGSHPHLASVLLQGRKSANIHASSGVIRGIPDRPSQYGPRGLGRRPEPSRVSKAWPTTHAKEVITNNHRPTRLRSPRGL